MVTGDSGRLWSAGTVLTVANFNMHCGMDGWGRPYDYVEVIASFDSDVIVLEESWTAEGEEEGQAEKAAGHLGYQIVAHTLGSGRRVRTRDDADSSWIKQPAWSISNRALFMDGIRPQPAKVHALPRWREAEPGRWGMAMLVRPHLAIDASRVLPLSLLRSDLVHRVAVVLDLEVEGHPISVAGTHMSHLHYGSHRNWAELRELLRRGARPDAVLLGDMNTWGPLVVTLFMPGWRRAVVGRTWPAWRPHSQIDHILVRGALQPVRGEVLPHAGSDHRPVRAELKIG
jgi:endonuclease/exonuclease/phosphatase family metal-dependent hydrolase